VTRRYTDNGSNLDENDNYQIVRVPGPDLNAKNNVCLVLRQSDDQSNPSNLVLINEGDGDTIETNCGARLSAAGFLYEPAIRSQGFPPKHITKAEILDMLSDIDVNRHRINGEIHLMPLGANFAEVFNRDDGATVSALDLAGLAIASAQALFDTIDNMAKAIDALREEVKGLKNGDVGTTEDKT